MNTKLLLAVLASALMLGLTSCPETSVPRDFGAKPVKLKAEEWAGSWRPAGEDESFQFVIKDASKGLLNIVLFNKEKKTEEIIEAQVRQTNQTDEGRLFFFTTFDKPNSAMGSLNLITKPEKDVFHLWNLNHGEVEAAIKRGELKGSLEPVTEKDEQGREKTHNHSRLSADASNYEKLTDSKFWEWSNPTAYERARKTTSLP
jgi:hypothetical protein